MYQIIGHPNSRASRLAWCLEELGQPYDYVPVMPHDAAIRAHNPSGKMPVLLDGDLAVPDSVAGMIYLADKHGALTHAAGSAARAHQDSLLHLVCDELDGALWSAAKHTFALPEAQRVAGVKDTARFEWTRGCKNLAQRIKGPFACGETFTITDILAGHCAHWAERAKFDVPDEIAPYFERLLARPSWARAGLAGSRALEEGKG